MRKGLCYADAARLLGGEQPSKIITALDRLTGGLLLAASAGGSAFALCLFDAKFELVRLSGELVSGVSRRLRGVTRMARGEQLAAAHAVIVISAFFDAVRESPLPFDVEELEITAAEQVTLATGSTGQALALALLRSNVPIPTPDVPYERALADLNEYYGELAQAVANFIAGLAVWDRLDATAQSAVCAGIVDAVPGRAIVKYEDMLRRLAAEFPEVAFWSNLIDHQATRAEIDRLHSSLTGMAEVLSRIATGRPPNEGRMALARAYRAALKRPLLPIDEELGDLSFPVVGEAYVNPDFRVAEGLSTDQFTSEEWWAERPRRSDLQEFFIGHLTTPCAAQAPLVVLGQPGSGKSLLTQVLAARLPPSDFLAVRVVLREVPADADLQTQIEHSIRAVTGETVSWLDFVRSCGDALPVILVDGFDELLQATGLNQSNYLEKVAAFQRREADLGRAVVVIVTSRTSVADRVRPVDGVVTVRLEPFDDQQIGQWLAVWHETNAANLAGRGLRPLPAETALDHADLARQPLLLLMLALYDADGNSLQRQGAAFSQAELYERLLIQFARREVLKTGASRPDVQVDEAVERELLRLSVVAFAMFNRGKLWVTDAELDVDLLALLGDGPGTPITEAFAPLTAAQIVIGRFYFVHVAQTIRDAHRLRTYEFLHATFGEYLIARQAVQELVELARSNTAYRRPRVVEDYFLHALLSFTPLTMRSNVVTFTYDLIRALPESQQALIRHLLLQLFHNALQPRKTTSLSAYLPEQADAPVRYAAYSANLCLLTTMITGEVTTAELFPNSTEQANDWSRLAALWASQLPKEGYQGLVWSLAVGREWMDEHRVVRLRFGSDAQQWQPDPYWAYRFHPGDRYRPAAKANDSAGYKVIPKR